MASTLPPTDTGTDTAADASALLRAAGARITAPRLLVLRVLRAAPAPLCHREVLDRAGQVAGAMVDRVTIYRVLDWLVGAGLAVKAADANRVFRFSASEPAAHHDRHVHFRCTQCGGVFCLKDAPPPLPRLPRGFRLAQVNVDIQGQCARCVQS